MADLKNFSDEELISELRNRRYAFTTWEIEDVTFILDDLKEECYDFDGLDLTDQEKYNLLVPIVQDFDKSEVKNFIEDAIIELLNKKKQSL